MNIDLLIEKISDIVSYKRHIIIAIDGPCASGKTTLAKSLCSIYDANVFHADDFFLRPEQRTAERLSQVGGNFDRERFMTEIIIPLKEEREFSYRPFCCKTQSQGDKISVPYKKLNIVEGSYCEHPFFDDAYDLKVFLDISPQEQKKRILIRNPHNAERFFGEWIPKENAYFEKFKIKENADLILQ